MAGHKANNEGSSPSSNGQSIHGTPDTNLTTFTPEDRANKSTGNPKMTKLTQNNFCTGLGVTGLGNSDKDPFVSGDSLKLAQKLSPTASTFQPFGLSKRDVIEGPMVVSSPGPDTRFTRSKFALEAALRSSPSHSGSTTSSAQVGAFSTDTNVTRILKVTSVYGSLTLNEVESYVMQSIKKLSGELRFYSAGGDVLIRTTDVGDTQQIFMHFRAMHSEWAVKYITPSTFAEAVDALAGFTSSHEGQISLVATFYGHADRIKLESVILDVLSAEGDIYAYQKQLASEAGTFKLIAEYSDIRSAGDAVEHLSGSNYGGMQLIVDHHRPDAGKGTATKHGLPFTPPRKIGSHDYDLTKYLKNVALNANTQKESATTHKPQEYQTVLSPTGRSLVPSPYSLSPSYSGMPAGLNPHCTAIPMPFGFSSPSAHMSPFSGVSLGSTAYQQTLPYGQSTNTPSRDRYQHSMALTNYGTPVRRNNAMRIDSRSPFNNTAGHHNVVDTDRIKEGSDVRTTIMLRNIPNKIDQIMLKQIIDETSFGLYDFMYLRIDFANNCNVGYAFINFEDPYHIVNFVEARAGQRWNRFNSDKVAEVSYATIQGKDCLVQKFRNSSVMLEAPTYRPKIFYTLGHPNAGREEDFPPPDNASKMRRSVENAEHVGLFAPRAGQHYRDEQRRRRSQYDRGTRLAALEEFDMNESVGLPYSGGSYHF